MHPYARIEIVHFLDEVGDRFTEKILHGSIHLQLEAALRYIREQVLLEKVIKVLGDEKAYLTSIGKVLDGGGMKEGTPH